MSQDFLSTIVASKKKGVAQLRSQKNGATWRERALRARESAPRHRLREALQADSTEIKIIAEFKRKSPSRGVIRSDLSATDAAKFYERGGACAISVLTEESHFDGLIDDLVAIRTCTRLPILRKDFIIDPIQIYESAIAGADAILLIATILDDPTLKNMRTIADDEFGLDALVEVHTSEELHRALHAGAKLVGVNNRDLHTFEVSIGTSERLIAEAPRDILMISESGFRDADQLRHLHTLGFRGFLIGETLMQADDPERTLREMIGTK